MREKLSPYEGQEVMVYPLPEISELDLEKAQFKSDGHGRAYMLIDVNNESKKMVKQYFRR